MSPNGNDGNGGATKERVRQLEGRVKTVEGDLKGFFGSYNEELLKRAEWRGKLDGSISEFRKDLKELKQNIGRRKSDRVKLMGIMITVLGLVVVEIIRLIF